MIELTSLAECPFTESDSIVCGLGFFDGVHRAHQTILNTCKQRAAQRGGKAIAFTFQNHPSEILSPENSTPLLMPYPVKKRWMSHMGLDGLVALPFTEEFSRISADEFIQSILINCLHAKEIAVGFDFHYGHKRSGSASDLLAYAPESFEAVTIIDRQQIDGSEISSTRIRSVIQQGDLATAEEWLGHPIILGGTVVKGDGRGRSIGIPTANLNTGNQLLPPNGVYGVRVHVDEIGKSPIDGVMNIGVLPTFKNEPVRTVEIHLLNHDADLYDRYLLAEVVLSIRGEQKFDGPDALIAQIHQDIETFRQRKGAQ